MITAVVLEGRRQGEVARCYGVSPGWVSRLVARYREVGEAAFEPRSRRPGRSPTAVPAATVELICRLRDGLGQAGLDAGPHTIVWHLATHHDVIVSPATVWRTLRRHGLVVDAPQKRPRSSYLRFAAEQPNQMWQADFTHVRLVDGSDVEVLTFLDDHSRYALTITAHRRVSGADVVTAFGDAVCHYGAPASVLTDNGMVFTTRFAGGRGGRNAFQAELARLGIVQKNSRPNHPTTCGKVERFQQTTKGWLRCQPPPATTGDLQALLDTWRHIYNTQRRHRSLGRDTPAEAYQARPKATPAGGTAGSHDRVRRDRIDDSGVVTLRVNGRLHHIGVGRAHASTDVIMLVHDLDIRVVDTNTGELLRALTLNPDTDYQPQHMQKPPSP